MGFHKRLEKKENGKTYYYVNNRKVTGVKKSPRKYYRFSTKTGAMYTNRRIVDTKGNICYYGADGARYANGFHKVKINGKMKTFYFSKSGIAHKGWATIGRKKILLLQRNILLIPGQEQKKRTLQVQKTLFLFLIKTVSASSSTKRKNKMLTRKI